MFDACLRPRRTLGMSRGTRACCGRGWGWLPGEASGLHSLHRPLPEGGLPLIILGPAGGGRRGLAE